MRMLVDATTTRRRGRGCLAPILAWMTMRRSRCSVRRSKPRNSRCWFGPHDRSLAFSHDPGARGGANSEDKSADGCYTERVFSGPAQQALSECRDRELTVGGYGLGVFVGVVLDELLDVRKSALGRRIGEIRLQV